jgi:V8-like Glu-specific endopeptidase
MKRLLTAACLLAATGAFAQRLPKPEPNVIYGSDDRLDLYQVKDQKVLSLADSTVALFEGANVELKDGQAALTTHSYSQSYNLCKEEPFYDQEAGAFCSGSLVGPDLVMTAGHCVPTADACPGIKFVFGFGIKSEGAQPKAVAASEVYGCGQLIGREQNNTGADWALVKLDRPVTGHAPLKLDRGGEVANGDFLFVIGHPAGLPTKVAGGAKVRDASPQGFFVANLDTYGGNSGSAVFNAKTGLVEGILVRGEQDYVYKGECRVSNVCPADGCRGEDVTKIGSVGFPSLMSSAAAPARSAPIAPGLAALLDANASALQRQ